MKYGKRMKIILNEEVHLTFSDIYGMNKLLYKPFKKWDAFDDGIIDEDGKILKDDKLSNAELYILNIKKLIVSNARVNGTKGQKICDYKILKFVDFLHESAQYNLQNKLTENNILQISISKSFNKIINNYIKYDDVENNN